MKKLKIFIISILYSLFLCTAVYAEGWVEQSGDWYYADKEGNLLKDTYYDGYYLSLDGKWVKETDAARVANMIYDKSVSAPNEYIQIDSFIEDKYVEPIAMALRDYRFLSSTSIVVGRGDDGANYVKFESNEQGIVTKQRDTDTEEWLSNVALNFVNLPNDVDKINAINQWICESFNYDTTFANYTAYDLMTEGTGVCNAYATVFKKLCNKVGIRCDTVAGKANNGKIIDTHAWNRVYVNGLERYVDCCWNDTTGKNKYLIVPKEEILKDHQPEVIY